MEALKQFIRDEEGVTAIEYALIAALMAVAIIASFGTITSAISEGFQTIADAISGAGGEGGS